MKQTALRLTARVQKGHRLEINAPELPVGEDVDVFVVLPRAPEPARPALLMEFLDSLPPGPRSATAWEEIERQLSEGRASWER